MLLNSLTVENPKEINLTDVRVSIFNANVLFSLRIETEKSREKKKINDVDKHCTESLRILIPALNSIAFHHRRLICIYHFTLFRLCCAQQ